MAMGVQGDRGVLQTDKELQMGKMWELVTKREIQDHI